MTNFTASHESRVPLLGDERVQYPDRHIEVDNRLAWFLGRLDKRFGNNAYYVHLTRDYHKVVASWSRRFYVLGGMATGYRDYILSGAANRQTITREVAASDYVRTVTENIEMFLKNKSEVMHFSVENAHQDFPRFWEWIGARGDLSAAMSEWQKRHDTEQRRRALKQRVYDFIQRGRRVYFPPR